VTAFCDFAGAGDDSVLAIREGNAARIVHAWRHRDTMNSVGRFIHLFRDLKLQGFQIGGDEGYGHQLRRLQSFKSRLRCTSANGSLLWRSQCVTRPRYVGRLLGFFLVIPWAVNLGDRVS
jgi:hypothetical protein